MLFFRLFVNARVSSKRRPPRPSLFPYTTLFRSGRAGIAVCDWGPPSEVTRAITRVGSRVAVRSEEHTSELQSRGHLVCRLLLEKKKNCYGVLSFCHFGGDTRRDYFLTDTLDDGV